MEGLLIRKTIRRMFLDLIAKTKRISFLIVINTKIIMEVKADLVLDKINLVGRKVPRIINFRISYLLVVLHKKLILIKS